MGSAGGRARCCGWPGWWAGRGRPCSEARIARDLGYDVGLLSLGALARATDAQLMAHCRAVAETIPLMGFYLQPSVGGRVLSYRFWRRFVEIEDVVAIKIAPFNRYATLDVVRAVADAGREREIALLHRQRRQHRGRPADDLSLSARARGGVAADGRRTAGPLGVLDPGRGADWSTAWLGCAGARCRPALLSLGAATTDANGAIFDAANGFRGCIPGIHEILRRQGLLRGRWCLDPREELSPGQMKEIDRVLAAYPELSDDAFVKANLDRWLAADRSTADPSLRSG